MRRKHVSHEKMKVKVLCRNPQDYLRQRKTDIHKLPRNLDPALHPLEGPREYVRALNATKLDRVFAKPFVGSLSGHTDGVYCLSKHPKQLSILLSGSCDGEIRIWNLARQECLTSVSAHSGFVRGLCMNTDGTTFVSVGEDKIVKQWQYPGDEEEEEEGGVGGKHPLEEAVDDQQTGGKGAKHQKLCSCNCCMYKCCLREDYE